MLPTGAAWARDGLSSSGVREQTLGGWHMADRRCRHTATADLVPMRSNTWAAQGAIVTRPAFRIACPYLHRLPTSGRSAPASRERLRAVALRPSSVRPRTPAASRRPAQASAQPMSGPPDEGRAVSRAGEGAGGRPAWAVGVGRGATAWRRCQSWRAAGSGRGARRAAGRAARRGAGRAVRRRCQAGRAARRGAGARPGVGARRGARPGVGASRGARPGIGAGAGGAAGRGRGAGRSARRGCRRRCRAGLGASGAGAGAGSGAGRGASGGAGGRAGAVGVRAGRGRRGGCRLRALRSGGAARLPSARPSFRPRPGARRPRRARRHARRATTGADTSCRSRRPCARSPSARTSRPCLRTAPRRPRPPPPAFRPPP